MVVIVLIVSRCDGHVLCQPYARAVKEAHSSHIAWTGRVALVNTWGMRKTIGAVAVAAAVAGVGGAAIAAATETGYHPNSGGFGGPAGPPPSAHHISSDPLPLHGENVVADDHGGFSTLVTQTGTITAISPTAVTARSADGFMQTYVIHQVEGANAPPFAVGDPIVITATRKGETTTVSTMGPPLLRGN